MDIGRVLQNLDARVKRVERSPRLSHAAIDNTAMEVRDGSGTLRGLLGVQSDGTTAVNIVNGAAPPQPSAPIAASVLGGVTVSWDGTFTGGAVLPLDWSRIEVHASILASYEPIPATLQGTIETAQGATVVIPCDTPVYVRLLARNTSGTASVASDTVGPFGPAPVVADDILDGIVTTVKLAAGAVTEAKIAANAVGTVALQDSAVLAENLADAAVAVGKIANNAVTGPAIASAAITAGKLAADSVTATNIQADAVTAAKVAAGAITTDKLTVTGGANILTDPSFEGAYTAACIAGLSYASQDTTSGNGSPTSLKIDATAATGTYRSVQVTVLPVLPDDQLNLGIDYWVSTDWAGTDISFQVRWETSAGAILSYGKAAVASPVRGAWTRLTGTFTAPATATVARIRAESGNGTAGFVRFDNASVRPVLPGTQIQDGVITTQKIAALTILAGNIAADAIAAGKIAADAVTAREIAALAVTAAEIAANTITAGKLQAGAVDATALAADAITGKTITGGTITGSVIQTATSGQRITLNESSTNKILVYNSSGAVGELSAVGLQVKGTNGSVLWLDPNNAFPNLRLTSADQSNSAVINVSGTEARLGMNSGLFTGSSYTDMKWRSFFGSDFAVLERIRESNATYAIGGRLDLRSDKATLAFNNADNTAQTATLSLQANLAQFIASRMEITVPASAYSALYINADSGHTGNLLRLQYSAADKFTVDKDGNATAAGMLTAGNLAAGRVQITPSAANVPTSINVTGLSLQGTNVRVVATPATTAPGTSVTGVGVTNQSTTGFTVWVTRTNTTATNIDWIAYATP